MNDSNANVKDLAYYMSLPYQILVTPSPEGGFSAKIPDLPGCITQAETFSEVFDMVEDAKKCWISSALEDEEEIPEPIDPFKPNGHLQLRIPRSLHKKLSKSAAAEGVSVNQMATYLLAGGLGVKLIEEN